MANKPKHKMAISDRAKQFAPFSALKGLEEALKEKERQIVPQKELSEESAALLTRKLTALKAGDFVCVTYFSDGAYISQTGIVSKIDAVFRTLTVVKTVIPIDQIYDISTEKDF